MRQLITFSIFIFILFPATGSAQQLFTIKGTVISPDDQPVAFLSVGLLEKAKNTIIKGTITDSAGRFEIRKVPAGEYDLVITAVNTQKKIESVIVDSLKGDVTLPAIRIELNAEELAKVVVVQSKAPFVVGRKQDKIIISINPVIAKGNSVLDLLPMLPGVKASGTGISINGRDNILLLIDGKRQYYTATQLQTVLTNMQAGTIESIEIMPNANARYDGNVAAVINIRTNKAKMISDIHSFYSQPFYPGNGNTGLNYRTFNVGTNLYFRFKKLSTNFRLDYTRPKDLEQTMINRSINRVPVFESTRENITRSESLSYTATLEWSGANQKVFGINMNGFSNLSFLRRSVFTLDYVSGGNKDSTLRTLNLYKNLPVSYLATGIYYSTRTKANKELNFIVDLVYNSNHLKNLFSNDLTNADHQMAYSEELDVRQKTRAFVVSPYINYKLLNTKKRSLEVGTKFTNTFYENTYDFKQEQTYPAHSLIDTNTAFNYTENIISLYAIADFFSDKLDWQISARGEQVINEQNNKSGTGENTLSAKRLNLFPSFNLNYKVSAKHNLNLSYSRKIKRPFLGEFNPTTVYRLPYESLAGNSFIKNEFTNQIDLSHNYKNKLTTTLSFNNRENRRTLIPVSISSSQTIMRVDYLDFLNEVMLGVNYSTAVSKVYRISLNSSASFIYFRSRQFNFRDEATSINIFLNNVFNFSNRFNGQFSLRYDSPSKDGFLKLYSFFQATARLTYNSKSKKLSATLIMNDLFATSKLRLASDYPGLSTYTEQLTTGRYIALRFNYNFSTGDLFVMKRKTSRNFDDIRTR